MLNPRAIAAQIITTVSVEHTMLSRVVNKDQLQLSVKDQALVQELVYGVLRWQPRLEFLLTELLQKPLKAKDAIIKNLLLVGLYQLIYLRTPAHAAVHATVQAVRQLHQEWAVKLVNAVLRNFQRHSQELLAKVVDCETAQFAHPAWLIAELKQHWPSHWQKILDINNQYPPLTLRVNTKRITSDAYLKLLQQRGIVAQIGLFSPEAIILQQAMDVKQLPGFMDGLVSVQDQGAQLAARLLDCQPGMRVLDACSAPGGKTSHILELCAEAKVLALDCDASRLTKVQENLDRLQLTAKVLQADATESSRWFDGELFDRILLDAPCSATGVIRRHPDLKILRTLEQVQSVSLLQAKLLGSLWPLLKPKGRLLYCTCSIMPLENDQQLQAFIAKNATARVVSIAAPWGIECRVGRQIFPDSSMDGLYYCCLEKLA